MITKEELVARRALLEDDLKAQNDRAAQLNGQIQDGQRRLVQTRDLINSLSGAKQDVDYWLSKFPADPPAPGAEPVETIVAKDGQPAEPEAPPKETLN